MARTIDRELVSYQALARYYAVTGNADDETAAAAAEAELKAAIAKSASATTASARREQIAKLQSEFEHFTKIFGEIGGLIRDNKRIAQDQLLGVSNKVRSKFDDLGDTAALAGLEFGAELGEGPWRSISVNLHHGQHLHRQTGAENRRWRDRALEVSGKFAGIDPREQRKDHPAGCRNYGVAEGVSCFLRPALRECKIHRKAEHGYDRCRRGDPATVQQPEIGFVCGSAADRYRDQRHNRGNQAVHPDARGGRSCPWCRAGADAGERHFASDDQDVQGDARARRRQFRRRAARPRPQG